MSDILVISSAYTTDAGRWRLFRDSCARFSVPVHMFGVGDPNYPAMEGIRNYVEFLKGRDEKYILGTDAYDVICNRWDEVELRFIIDSAPHVVMSVEPLVWPVGYDEVYSRVPSHYSWRAINGGQYCGRREQMLEVWEETWRRWQNGDATNGGTSQEILHQMFRAGFAFTLDLQCRVFQSMIGAPAKFIECRSISSFTSGEQLVAAHAYNTVTKSIPMFLHFNGQAPGLQEWGDRLLSL